MSDLFFWKIMFGHFLTELKGKLALKGRWSIVLKVIVRLTDGQSAGKDPRSTNIAKGTTDPGVDCFDQLFWFGRFGSVCLIG